MLSILCRLRPISSGSSLRKINRGGMSKKRMTIDDLGRKVALGMGKEIRRLVFMKASDRKSSS